VGRFTVDCVDSFGFFIGPANVKVHDIGKCFGSNCCIHNPSRHHMKTWKQIWRDDHKIMHRMCLHGIGHPDPDDISKDRNHHCCGCCDPNKFIEGEVVVREIEGPQRI